MRRRPSAAAARPPVCPPGEPGPWDRDERTPDARALLERLRQLRAEPPAGEDAFRAALHRRLVAAGPPPARGGLGAWLRRAGPVLWPVSGVAAGVAAFLVMGALQGPPPVPAAPDAVAVRAAPVLPGTQVPVSKVAVIKLGFTTDVSVEDAAFQVSLPEGLVFYADGEELPLRSFEWRQTLQAGSNVIPVAVRGSRPGRYLVTASARAGDQRIEHEVVLEVTEG